MGVTLTWRKNWHDFPDISLEQNLDDDEDAEHMDDMLASMALPGNVRVVDTTRSRRSHASQTVLQSDRAMRVRAYANAATATTAVCDGGHAVAAALGAPGAALKANRRRTPSSSAKGKRRSGHMSKQSQNSRRRKIAGKQRRDADAAHGDEYEDGDDESMEQSDAD